MIRRLTRNHYRPGNEGLLEGELQLRNLRVVIDSEILASGGGTSTPEQLLVSLLGNEAISTWRYRDSGPEDDAGTVPWVVAEEVPEPTLGSHTVRWQESSSHRTIGGILGNMVRIARDDETDTTYSQLSPEGAAVRRAADATAVGAAEALSADLFVTTRPYALVRQWSQNGVTVATPGDALPLVGLYLRSRGTFVVYGDSPGHTELHMNRGLFYRSAIVDMFPSGWRWERACRQHDPDGLGPVAGAVFDRFARTLRVRDNLLRAVNRTQDNDVGEDALLALDTALLMLMGAFDSAARVAHKALNLTGSPFSASWQRSNWWAKVDVADPALAALVQPADPPNHSGADGAALLSMLSRVRNSVHGAGLEAMAIGTHLTGPPIRPWWPSRQPTNRRSWTRPTGSAAGPPGGCRSVCPASGSPTRSSYSISSSRSQRSF